MRCLIFNKVMIVIDLGYFIAQTFMSLMVCKKNENSKIGNLRPRSFDSFNL